MRRLLPAPGGRDMTGKISVLAPLFAVLTAGCGNDCREAARLGEFELTQGNYERAVLQFEKAWKMDSLGCPGVKERLRQAREFRDKSSGR